MCGVWTPSPQSSTAPGAAGASDNDSDHDEDALEAWGPRIRAALPRCIADVRRVLLETRVADACGSMVDVAAAPGASGTLNVAFMALQHLVPGAAKPRADKVRTPTQCQCCQRVRELTAVFTPQPYEVVGEMHGSIATLDSSLPLSDFNVSVALEGTTSLRSLNISGNRLSQLPTAVTEQASLGELVASQCRLSAFPSKLCSALGGCLTSLDLSRNRLTVRGPRAEGRVRTRLTLGCCYCAHVCSAYQQPCLSCTSCAGWTSASTSCRGCRRCLEGSLRWCP